MDGMERGDCYWRSRPAQVDGWCREKENLCISVRDLQWSSDLLSVFLLHVKGNTKNKDNVIFVVDKGNKNSLVVPIP